MPRFVSIFIGPRNENPSNSGYLLAVFPPVPGPCWGSSGIRLGGILVFNAKGTQMMSFPYTYRGQLHSNTRHAQFFKVDVQADYFYFS